MFFDRAIFWRPLGLVWLAGCSAPPYPVTGDPARPFLDPRPCPTDRVESTELDRKTAHLKSRFGIEVRYAGIAPGAADITLEPLNETDYPSLSFYLDRLEAELGLYFPGVLAHGKIGRVDFVRNARVLGKPASGIASHREERILFDFPSDVCDPLWTTGTIHHEILHMLQINSATNFLPVDEWTGLNQWPFFYQDQRRVLGAPVHPPGFVTDYAMKSAWEDSAETYAALMTPKASALLADWLAGDEVLTRKVSFLKDRFRKLSPGFDEAFWDARRRSPLP